MYSTYNISYTFDTDSLRSKNKHTSKRPLMAKSTTVKKKGRRTSKKPKALGPKEIKKKIGWNRLGDKRGRRKK